MPTNIEISHHGFEASEALDDCIKEQMKKLERFHDGIVSCRVSLEQASHRRPTHEAWDVKVRITVPPRHELVACKSMDHPKSNQQAVYQTVEAAFQAVAKQLRKLVDKHG